MAIEIVDFPINSMVIFHSYVKLPEGKTWKNQTLDKQWQTQNDLVLRCISGSPPPFQGQAGDKQKRLDMFGREKKPEGSSNNAISQILKVNQEHFSKHWMCVPHKIAIWVWVNTYRYIFSGMNIHLPAILGFTRYQGFDPSPYFFKGSGNANRILNHGSPEAAPPPGCRSPHEPRQPQRWGPLRLFRGTKISVIMYIYMYIYIQWD